MEKFNIHLDEHLSNLKFAKIFKSFLIFVAFCIGSLCLSYFYEHNASIRALLRTDDPHDDNILLLIFGIIIIYPIIFLFVFLDSIHKSQFKGWEHFIRDITIIIISILLLSNILKKIVPLYDSDSLYLIVSLVFNIYLYYIFKEFKKWKRIKRNMKSINKSEKKINEFLEEIKNVPHIYDGHPFTTRHCIHDYSIKFYLFINNNELDYLTYELNKSPINDSILESKKGSIPILIMMVNRNKRGYSNDKKIYDIVCILDIYYKDILGIKYIGRKLFYEKESSVSFFNKYTYAKIDRNIKDFISNYSSNQITLEQTSWLINDTEKDVKRYWGEKYVDYLNTEIKNKEEDNKNIITGYIKPEISAKKYTDKEIKEDNLPF